VVSKFGPLRFGSKNAVAQPQRDRRANRAPRYTAGLEKRWRERRGGVRDADSVGDKNIFGIVTDKGRISFGGETGGAERMVQRDACRAATGVTRGGGGVKNLTMAATVKKTGAATPC